MADNVPDWFNKRVENSFEYFIDLLNKKIYIYNKTGNYYGKLNLYLVIHQL